MTISIDDPKSILFFMCTTCIKKVFNNLHIYFVLSSGDTFEGFKTRNH